MFLFVVVILLGFFNQSSKAEEPNPAKSWQAQREFFAAVQGHWECAGSFADGRPIAADLTFNLDQDTRTLEVVHRDRAPNQFIGHWLWGTDEKNNQIVSFGFVGIRTKSFESPAFLVGRHWTSHSLTLEAQALTSPLSTPNRFTYSIDSGQLNVVWEVQRDGTYKVGDRLGCKRLL